MAPDAKGVVSARKGRKVSVAFVIGAANSKTIAFRFYFLLLLLLFRRIEYASAPLRSHHSDWTKERQRVEV